MASEGPMSSDGNSPALTWTGDMGDHTALYFVAHLDHDSLYISSGFLTQSRRDAAARRLEDQEPPAECLGWGTKRITLGEIRELRFCPALKTLDIVHGARRRRYEVHSQRDPIHLWLYSALRERLAPGTIPEAGTVST